LAEDTVSKPEGVPFPSPTAGPVSDWSLTVYESLKDWAGRRGGSWARWEPGYLVLTIDKHNGEQVEPAVIHTSGDALTVTFGYWDDESREVDDAAALSEIRQWAENWIEGVWSTAVYTQEDGRWCGSRCIVEPGIPERIADVEWISNFNPTHVEIRRARKSEWRRYAIVDGALIDDPRSRHD
jgi:hypothetical protein